LYGFLVLRHSRREILWLDVTAHPNAEWIARQLTDACGWSKPPQYIIGDRERPFARIMSLSSATSIFVTCSAAIEHNNTVHPRLASEKDA